MPQVEGAGICTEDASWRGGRTREGSEKVGMRNGPKEEAWPYFPIWVVKGQRFGVLARRNMQDLSPVRAKVGVRLWVVVKTLRGGGRGWCGRREREGDGLGE